MREFEKSIEIMSELFGKDCTFTFSTVSKNIPSSRVVDTYFDGKYFWIVTYKNTRKVSEIDKNPYVSLCNQFYNFQAEALNMGHPLESENSEIRKTLIEVFAPWYFAHNNEEDENMCYVKVVPSEGFFHHAGSGYRVNFKTKVVTKTAFIPDAEEIEL